MYKIPSDPAWCSFCLHPEEWHEPAGPCVHHRGPDGTKVPYKGLDVYEPSEWVTQVVGSVYRSADWTGKYGGATLYYVCIGYDPRHGFWMRNLKDPKNEKNISERAIDRTYHNVRPYNPDFKEAMEQLVAAGFTPKAA